LLHDALDNGTAAFWSKDGTIVLLLRVRQGEPTLWEALRVKIKAARVFVPDLLTYMERWLRLHHDWHHYFPPDELFPPQHAQADAGQRRNG
jgi:hypothetical protein